MVVARPVEVGKEIGLAAGGAPPATTYKSL